MNRKLPREPKGTSLHVNNQREDTNEFTPKVENPAETIDAIHDGSTKRMLRVEEQPTDYFDDRTATFDASGTSIAVARSLPRVIGGYEILGELGRGGMGVVYKAFQRGLKRTVALKMVLAGAHASSEQLKRFLAEAKAVAHLQHPHIVQVFDIGENEGLPYFSLEFVDGLPLSEKLAGQPQIPREAAAMSQVLATTMEYAHRQGILHRDLKPANVLLTKEGIPKIADFGLAKQMEESEPSSGTQTGTIMGTASYMSPEQALGKNQLIGPATDQYALGAILYEMLTGRPPFVAARRDDIYFQVLRDDPLPLRQLEKHIPVDLETICLKCLQKDIEQRYSSCQALADDLDRFLKGEPISARPVGSIERTWRWCKRNPTVAGLSATAVLLLMAIAIGSTWTAAVLSATNRDLKVKTELANNNAKEAVRRSDRMKEYIQETIKSLLTVDTYDNPRMRPFVKNSLDQMLPVLEEIVGELPETEQAAPTLASSLTMMVKGLKEQGNFEAASQKLEELVAFGERRLELKGHSDAVRVNQAKFLMDLAMMQLEANRNFARHFELLHRAEALAQDAVDHPRKAPDDGKGLLEFYQARGQLAEIKNRLATAHYRNGDPRKANELFDASNRLYQEILEAVPSGRAFEPVSENPLTDQQKKEFPNKVKNFVNTNQLALAMVYFRNGQADRAKKILTQVVAVTKKLHDDDPELPSKAMQYVGFLGTLSEVLNLSSEDPKDILAQLEEAAKIADRFCKQDEQNAEKRRRTALAHYRVGQWRRRLNDSKAEDNFQRCLELRKLAASMDPSNDRKQLDLMIARSALGETEGTLEIVDKYQHYPLLDNEMRIDLARALSRLSERLEGDPAESCRTRAIEFLQDAIQNDFKDKVYLNNELDFQPLQQHEAFRAMIQVAAEPPTKKE